LSSDGSTVREATLDDSGGVRIPSSANSAAVQLGVVAAATPPGQDVHYVRVDVSVIAGTKCNYHALVTPSS
jgi:hypothetical protein